MPTEDLKKGLRLMAEAMEATPGLQTEDMARARARGVQELEERGEELAA